jgi:hypothetical protein
MKWVWLHCCNRESIVANRNVPMTLAQPVQKEAARMKLPAMHGRAHLQLLALCLSWHWYLFAKYLPKNANHSLLRILVTN